MFLLSYLIWGHAENSLSLQPMKRKLWHKPSGCPSPAEPQPTRPCGARQLGGTSLARTAAPAHTTTHREWSAAVDHNTQITRYPRLRNPASGTRAHTPWLQLRQELDTGHCQHHVLGVIICFFHSVSAQTCWPSNHTCPFCPHLRFQGGQQFYYRAIGSVLSTVICARRFVHYRRLSNSSREAG